MYKQICITNSYYVLLVYLLLTNQIKDTFFIFGDSIKIKPEKNMYWYRIKNLIHPCITELITYYYFSIKLRNLPKDIQIYGQDHILGANYLKEKFNFNVIEDGLSFYDYIPILKKKLEEETYLRKRIKLLLKIYPDHGLYSKIKTIYMSKIKEIPIEFKNKEVIIFDIKKLWNLKSKREKENILSFLGIRVTKLQELYGADLILITQPLSEDNYMTEKEKIEIYKKICNNNNKIIIKPHPREKTKYENYFKNAIILEKNFPIEMLFLLEIDVKNIKTLFSTAVLNLKNHYDIEMYGTVNHNVLEKEIGKIEYKKINKL